MNREYESDLTNMGTWVHDFGDRLYRYQIYRRSYTPYEESQQFMDESIYEDDYYSFGYIKEAVELPDGDVLLGFQDPYIDDDMLEYVKLSEIRLSYYENDEADIQAEIEATKEQESEYAGLTLVDLAGEDDSE